MLRKPPKDPIWQRMVERALRLVGPSRAGPMVQECQECSRLAVTRMNNWVSRLHPP